MHKELEGKEVFQVRFPHVPNRKKLFNYLKGGHHELHISVKLIFHIG